MAHDNSIPIPPGHDLHDLARVLFPIHRSLTGNGVRQTLHEIRNLLPPLQIVEVPTGTRAFDWQVPDEWNIRDAYILDPNGDKIADFQQNNLHVVAYSEPVDKIVSLSELEQHLYSLPDQPGTIPFVMSYYERRWGFCVAHSTRVALADGNYRVFIDSSLGPGHLTYGELVLPGRESKEVLLSTYLCHPSMANDNLSGISVTAFLAKWLMGIQDRRYTYRILFIPETIGSILYLSRHLDHMKARTAAGFVITCVGDNGEFSFVPSRLGDTLADRVALHTLVSRGAKFKQYTYLDRGSDERQYCSPGVDLPVVSIMRSKYREYPEYHTSDDNLSLISGEALGESFEVLARCINTLECNYRYRCTCLCEPQLGRRGLFPTLSMKGSVGGFLDTMNVLAYCDGQHDLIDIARRTLLPVETCAGITKRLVDNGLVDRMSD